MVMQMTQVMQAAISILQTIILSAELRNHMSAEQVFSFYKIYYSQMACDLRQSICFCVIIFINLKINH
jgi:hypothetical protein